MLGKAAAQSVNTVNRATPIWNIFGAAVVITGQLLGFYAPAVHAAIVASGDVSPSNPATWTWGTTAYVGKSATGTVTVDGGSGLISSDSYLGYNSGSNGTVTVTGTGSTWRNDTTKFIVGNSGTGNLIIAAGGQVTNYRCFMANRSGSSGTVTVTGANSKWTIGNSESLYIAYSGSGTLNIEDGGEVVAGICHVNYGFNQGTIAVAGVRSKLTIDTLEVGTVSSGTLNIQAGGEVNAGFSTVAAGSTATVHGEGSKWTNSGDLQIGFSGNGTLNIEAGAEVTNTNGYLGYYSPGWVTVSGSGSKWINRGNLYVGYSGTPATLAIGSGSNSGGLVAAKTMTMSFNGGVSSCSISNGGTLQVGLISRYSSLGSADFRLNDGTIRNFDATTDLTISSNMAVKLGATGTHAFDIDLDRTGTINGVLRDTTSGGTIRKTGAGALVLTAVNTYSGETTVAEGRFKVAGSILNTSTISLGELGILELASASGSATAATLPIENDGLFLISAGSQTVGTLVGGGRTQVNAGTSLTARSISQDSLVIGAVGASPKTATEWLPPNVVPEPGTLALLVIGFSATMTFGRWRRRL
jgi:fibronectin-binding autotransporter adhesin